LKREIPDEDHYGLVSKKPAQGGWYGTFGRKDKLDNRRECLVVRALRDFGAIVCRGGETEAGFPGSALWQLNVAQLPRL